MYESPTIHSKAASYVYGFLPKGSFATQTLKYTLNPK
jgi:hypothetical protein